MGADENRILLTGTVKEPLCYSHRIYGEDFYSFSVTVRRRSGNADHLMIMVSERLLRQAPSPGDRCTVEGQIRTYNECREGRNHLKVLVFCSRLRVDCGDERISGTDQNELTLSGFVCRTPYYRISPLGREICDIMVASNRIHGKADYIPCITWGRNARFCAELQVGTNLRIMGRFQSRVYRKVLESGASQMRTAYEVSAVSLEVIGKK